jgi:phosphoglycerate dehydrogenase-like enzyme
MRILVTQQSAINNNYLQKKYLKQLKKIVPDIEVNFVLPKSADFYTQAKNADIVIAMADDINQLSDVPKLKWLHLTSAGANALSKELIESEIVVSNSSGVHPIPISEHVFGLMLMLARGLHKAVKVQITQKKWVRDINFYQPTELAGKKLLVVGMGRIGDRVAALGQAFEMQIVGIVRDPSKHTSQFELKSAKDLINEIKSADFVVNCLPSTSETIRLFDRKMFKIFKKGSFFINIGRGDTVDEAALISVLKSGPLAGAGLDVFETEPLSSESPLWKMENVIITPHYSGAKPHYFERMMEIFIINFKSFIQNQPLPNYVDKKLGY